MSNRISRISSSCFFHLRRLHQLHDVVCCSTTQRLVSAVVLPRLDYCNAMLAGSPSTTLNPLRRILSASVRRIADIGPRDHVTEQMMERCWLPISYRIKFMFCLTMHSAVTGQCPQTIRDIVHSLSTLPGRNTLPAAASDQFHISVTETVFGERALSVAGQCDWKTLPKNITHITN